MAAIIVGASAAHAKLIFGDNLYAYGPVDGPLTEDLPYRATGPNGRTRAQLATTLISAHKEGRVRAAIGRGSDFFGPHARQSLVADGVFARALAGKPAHCSVIPTSRTASLHRRFWSRAGDLGEREDALGDVWHVPNAPAVPLRRFVEMVFAVMDRPPSIQVVPRPILSLLALFNPMLRAVVEQLYQSDRPWIVDSSKFERAFGWQATPLEGSIPATAAWFKEHARL